MNLLDLTLPTPAENLACDEVLVDLCEDGRADGILRFWEPREYFVVVGYGNRVDVEVNTTACKAERVPILRRSSGGGAILQGPGCLNYSVILKLDAGGPLRSITSGNRFILERNRAALETLVQSDPGLRAYNATPAIRGDTDLALAELRRAQKLDPTAAAVRVAGKPIRQILAGIEGWEAKEGQDESRIQRAEIRFHRADGSEVFLGFSTSPMKDAEGQSIGRVVIFQDLTPIRQMEERVRIADRLAGVGELAAGLAHEIRNPLASIAGSSQLLRESATSVGESATLLDIIGRESQRLNGLITDFLAYTGPSQRNTARLDVASLLRDVVEAVRAGEAREKGVVIELARLPALRVEGDGEQLRQVAWNLVRNAVQAAPAGGKVMIDGFEQIRHGVRYVVAAVVDTGPGIAPGNLEKIFNPFFTTKEGGTGLGLSISQRIVHQHKGFIEVRQAPGKGSAFSVFLPASSYGNVDGSGDG